MSKTKLYNETIRLVVALIVIALALALSFSPVKVIADASYEEFTYARSGNESAAHDVNSITVAKPGNTVEGDLLIGIVITDGDTSGEFIGPTGWTLINVGWSGPGSEYPGGCTLSAWYWVAGDNEPGSYTWNWTSAETVYAFIIRITGHDSGDPIDVCGSNNGTSGMVATCPDITTTVADTLVLRIFGYDSCYAWNATYPSGHSGITVESSRPGCVPGAQGHCSGGAAYVSQATAGATGTASFQVTQGEGYWSWRTLTIAVRPKVNQAPVAYGQSLSVGSCDTLTVTLNGSDPDNEPLTYIISTLPGHGDLYDGTGTGGTQITSVPFTLTANNVTYTPNASYSGNESFGFKVNDGVLDSEEATISISITVSGCDDLDYYDDWEYYCVGDEVWMHRMFHDFSCVDSECVEVSSNYTDDQWYENCPADYYTDWVYYCNGDSVWRTRDLHDFYCLDGVCSENVTPQSEWVEDCPADYATNWTYYCDGDSVWRTRDHHDYYCLNGTCSENITMESEWYADCDDGDPYTIDTCVNGTCVHIAAYDLTMAADPEAGGTATDLTNASPYAEGTKISIKAEANEGYEFVNWTTPAGVFDDANATDTSFTMPAQNVTVTANFEEVPTVTTQAASGTGTSSATLHVNYTVGGFSSVEVRFAYKKSTDSAWSYTDWVSQSADGTYTAPLTGLSSNTQYDFKSELKYASTVIESAVLQFITAKSSLPRGCGCFIATAAYGTPTAEQIDVLREFRDTVLLKSTLGSQFVDFYYRFSPPVADFIASNELLRTLVRELLVDPIVRVVEATGDIWRN